ncbi:MAG: S41 family peptidase [Clostridiales bacterium]|jgi:carboxyl-terminal processing protease|nr:S41 family peptidase [Clostridiales bacterium]
MFEIDKMAGGEDAGGEGTGADCAGGEDAGASDARGEDAGDVGASGGLECLAERLDPPPGSEAWRADRPETRLYPRLARRFAVSMALTALLTAVTVVALLRFFGMASFSDAVFFNGGAHAPASVRKLQQVWDYISGEFYEQPDEDAMLESAAAAMAASVGDVYTVYYTKEQMRSFNERTAGAFYGIGVTVSAAKSGRLAVVGVAEGSPAEAAGVLPGDEIASVDGRGVEELADDQAVIDMIKGERGTMVKVGFYRPSDGATLEFEMERYEVRAENVAAKALDGGIGYIRISMFDSSGSKFFGQKLDELLEGGMRGLVIDLRDNPGGSFDEAVAIADRLLGEGVIVYTEDRRGERAYRRSDAQMLGMPLALLINSNSASASEIVAGAVKAHGAGKLVGQRTFGKGLVQNVVTLDDGSGLKYTSSKYFTPDGASIQGEGIEPDLAVALPDSYAGIPLEDIPSGGDAQLEAAAGEIARQLLETAPQGGTAAQAE